MGRGRNVSVYRRKLLMRRRKRNFREELWKEASRSLLGQVYVDRGGGPEDTFFMAGTGRSGTTWIAEVLNHDHAYRYLHEPFRPGRLKATEAFLPRQYLRPGDRDPRYLDPARAILSGRVRSLFADKYNGARAARKRLIKEVRGNLLLPWLHANFPEMPMVLVLRHPCAVATSQVRLAEAWRIQLERFLDQPALMEDHLEPFRDVIEGARTDFEKQILLWCIDNYVPLSAFRRGDLHLAFYERFCTEPEGEFERLFAFAGRRFDADAVGRLERPSATSQKDSAIVSGGSLVEGWRRHVSEEEIARAVELLSVFGLDRVYGADPMPRPADASGALGPRPRPAPPTGR